jgi:putative polyhydroxyalkanoate system protein
MAKIEVSRAHTKGKEAARTAAEHVANRLKDKLEATWRWAGDDIVFERTGAKGRIAVGDTVVRVEIELAFILRPLQGKVEQKAKQYLDEYLA